MKDTKPKSKNDVLNILAEASIYGNLGIFIGSGLSKAIMNNAYDDIALSWSELIEECANKLKIDYKSIKKEGLSYPAIATELCKKYSKIEAISYKESLNKLKEKISDLTCWYPSEDNRKKFGDLILNISPNWIITTNYDLILECLLTGNCISLTPNDQLVAPKNIIPIYHLHGIRTDPSSIVISQEDYIGLFRPTEYRQQKLPLTIKESTTLIIGYSLGDFNVLTAVDWTKNVYSKQEPKHPQGIVQFLHSNSPNLDPYYDSNEILIIEFDDLESILKDLFLTIVSKKADIDKNREEILKINEFLLNPSEETIINFIDDDSFRETILNTLAKNDRFIIGGFLEIFSKSIEKTWIRAQPARAFHAYDQNLKIILDILEKFEISQMPPALFESVAYNLNRVGYYVGKYMGESIAAYRSWIARKTNLSKETVKELRNIANSKGYIRIKELLNM